MDTMSTPITESVVIVPPPSANRLWKNFRGRVVKSRDYEDWLTHVQRDLAELGKAPSPCGVTIILHGGKGVTVRSDLDNLIKPTMDALRHAEVLADDNLDHVHAIHARFEPYVGKAKDRGFAELEVRVWKL